ncbi:DUF3822 family protein [Patiriisocius hiemis]|uniref:DUF3822 family protein n=1 Tax=Patiriisocius hiemis TaxID=3075604 RepID=A0ABU2YBZ0_9FLAO|nr:DUF3822 family protein [Constantimarinum sp. W242]MDT0554755.1 DUF3822 family protein [Constantimarinum sp. W242]
MTLLQKDNNIETLNTKRLSVQISLTGLSFLVHNLATKEVLFFKKISLPNTATPEEIEIHLKNTIDQEKKLKSTFNSVAIIYATDLSTLVPSTLFDETKLSEYLKFNAKILPSDYIAYDEVKTHDIINVYVPYVNINNYFIDTVGSFTYYHNSSLVLKMILDHEKHTLEKVCYINVFENHFNLFIIKNGTPLLVNSYLYKTPEDFIYYVLFAFEQLKINPDSIKTSVMGAIDKEDAIFEILYKYIRNIDFYSAYNETPFLSEEDAAHKNCELKYLL